MGRDDHAARHAFRADWHCWTVIEAPHDLAFRALLLLIRRQLQARLDEGVIEDAVLFAPRNIREANQIREDGPRAILPIEAQQSALLRELIRREVTRDRRQRLSQFRSVVTVAPVAKRAEPTFSYGSD